MFGAARRILSAVNLLPAVMHEISEVSDFEAALQTGLRKICELAAWDYGEIWFPTQDGKALECGPVWWGESFKEFHDFSCVLRFAPDIGLAGRIWASGKPEWIADISNQADSFFLLRAQMAQKAGLHAVLGVPLLADGLVYAVLVFLARDSRPEDSSLGIIQALGVQLATVMQRERTREDLRQSQERLRKADKLKSEFISAASHELKTPLTSMEGYLEAILEGDAGPLLEQQKRFLGYAKQAADRLHKLLDELLDISRLEAGQVKMNKSLTLIEELLKEQIMIFSTQAAGKEISLHLETAGPLGKIYCDADKIRQVLYHLITNALRCTPRGGSIKISALLDEDGVRVDVEDTGVGVLEQDKLRMFEPFQSIPQQNTEPSHAEGKGLGLTLVKKIVEAHEGEVGMKSQEGKGSTFTFTLPLRRSRRTRLTPWVMHYE